MVGALGISICFALLAGITALAMGFGMWVALATYSATGIVAFLAIVAIRVLRPRIAVSPRMASASRTEKPQYKR